MVPVTAAATFCATLVDEWRRNGLTHAVVCPGSRSTPLALALHEAASRGDIELAVVLDERSAGFLALGMARASGRPVPVLTTSGTAAVNLHPAIVEAHHDTVPLIACTADRPPELHGVGAPQTIDQGHLYTSSARSFIDVGVPDDTDPSTWRSMARRAWVGAAGYADPGVPPGPVHLNLPFREPLVGRPAPSLPDPDVPDPQPPRQLPTVPSFLGSWLGGGARTVVVAGPPDSGTDRLVTRAGQLGWPVLVDPRLGLDGPTVVRRADLVLRSDSLLARVSPDVVLRLGALPASKVVGTWLDSLGGRQLGIDPWGRRFDPGGSLEHSVAADADDLVRWLDTIDPASAPAAWTRSWMVAERAAEEVVAELLAVPGGSGVGGEAMTEPAVARVVSAAAASWGGALVVSSSMPIRDVEEFGDRRARPVYANRGANGIDGVVSTAVGVALASGTPSMALVGDLALLHDANGLGVLRNTSAALLLVVVDNGGGGIFHFLPQHDLLDPATFERLYGTPQGLDLVALIQAHGVPAWRVDTAAALHEAVQAPATGPAVLVVPTDRGANTQEHQRLAGAVGEAVSSALER